MYGGDCDAAIAKAAAAVTHVQSQSQEVGSVMKGWACCVLICHQQKRTFDGWRTSSRDFASSLLGKLSNSLNKNTHSIYGGDCDAAIAKAAAAVTHAQSQSQEVGSGDEGLGWLCFGLSSAETDFWWLEDEQ